MSKTKLVRENTKAKKKTTGLQQIEAVLRDLLYIAITVYMVLIIAVMPFYNQEGYTHIGTDKYTFLKTTGIYGAYIIIPLVLIYLAVHITKVKKQDHQTWKQGLENLRSSLSVTDISAICFAVTVVVSYLSTDYRDEALWGTKGWYMGLTTQLLFVGVYFLISRMWKPNKWIPLLFLPVSFIVFVLAYLNRFGIYPIEMAAARPSFISTIGNINWFCGYQVTVFFGGAYMLWRGEKLKGWAKALLFAYLAVGFGALVTQGSSSGILTLAGVLLVFFLLSAADGQKMKAFLEIVLTLAAACLITFGIRKVAPEAITYQEGSVDLLTLTPLPIVMVVAAAGLWCWVSYTLHKDCYPVKLFRSLAWIAGVGTVAGMVLLFLLIVINTKFPGSLGALSDISLFTFNPQWGSMRGATWTAGFMCFAEQGLWKKLVGVGPDCMAAFIYGNGSDKLLGLMHEAFEGSRLTNAHNEWLTMLVNLGLFGLVSYASMIVSAVCRFLKKGNVRYIAGAAGICILAYTINNIFSFQQSMNAITMYVVMGIGEAYARKE